MWKELLQQIRANDPTLTEIYVYEENIEAAGAKALAEALKTNTSVTLIDLGENKIGAAGAKALAQALKTNTSVTKIYLGKNEIGDAGAQVLAEALKINTTLKTIDLTHNKIGTAGAQAMADALKLNTSVTTLDFKQNKIGTAGAQVLAEALKINTTLTTIDLTYNKIGIAGAQAMADALKLNTTVTTLDFEGNEIGAAGIQALADALKVNTTLTTISLRGNNIGAAVAQALAEALKTNTSVTKIVLRDNGIGSAGTQALAKALKTNTSVTSIYLSFNNIGAAGAQALAEALKTNSSVTSIDLGYNFIEAAGAQALAEALKVNTSVTDIVLRNNNIMDVGAQALAETLKTNTSVTLIDLEYSNIGDAGAQSLAEALKTNTSVTTIHLRCNNIGDAGAQALAEALKTNTSVMMIDLWFNNIGAAGAQALAEALKTNTSVTTIHLRCNNIGDAGAQALAEALKINTSVTTINLKDNNIGDAGAQALAEALKTNTSVMEIHLGCNNIGDAGSQALAEALKTNTSVTTIDLSQNNIGDAGVQALAEALKTNTSVTTIDLSENNIGDAVRAQINNYLKRNVENAKKINQQLLVNEKGELPKVDVKAIAISAPANPAILLNSVSANPSSSSSSVSNEPNQSTTTDAKKASSVTTVSSSSSSSSSSSTTSIAHLQTIPWHNLQLNNQDLLGHGAFGDVYRAKWLGTDVAVKVLHLKKLSAELQQDFEREASIMAQCHFPHVVRLYGIVAESQHYALVMEYVNQGSLHDVLHQKDTQLPWERRWEIAIGIAKGLAYLHGRNILHRDLKSMNILLNEHQPKITDFGLSRIKIETNTVTTLAHKPSGSIRWRAPELFKPKAKYTPACDVYSLGMILWELASRAIPFSDEKDDQMVISWIKDGEQETMPDDCPSAFAELIKACWHKNPDERPSAEALVSLLEKAKPQPQAQHAPLETKEPTKSWHFAEHLRETARAMVGDTGYALIPASPEDIGKVVNFYQFSSVPNMDIGRVYIIYNPMFNRHFQLELQALETRASKPAFQPKWNEEDKAELRSKINKLCDELVQPYTDEDLPHVKLAWSWHGATTGNLPNIFETGYANLQITDPGYFGQGTYSTFHAKYARQYGDGSLVLNWTAFFNALPAIYEDTKTYFGKALNGRYDACFAPVRLKAGELPVQKGNATVYQKIDQYFGLSAVSEKHDYIELMVTNPRQMLPRYLVELQPTLPKAPVNLGGTPHSLFFKGKVDEVTYVNLLAAAKYAYENYLSKPYTLKEGKDWQMDWQYQHPTNGKVISRPNHGLAHTLRKLFYLPSILEHYIAHQKLPEFEVKLLRNDIKVMQLALLFFISGRENDLGSQGNEVHFKRFREQSADNFERYVKAAGIKLTAEKILEYKEAMRWFDNPEDKGLVKHIRQILWQFHFIDLIRCLTPEQFNGAISYVDKNMGQARREQLIQLAQLSIEKTGDRLMAMEPKRGHQPDLFVEASSSVESCFKYLQTAYRAFETKLANPSSVPKPGK